jgi:hypothetical protein
VNDDQAAVGFAVAAFSLVGALMRALEEEGILEKRQVAELLDHVQLLMEQQGLSESATAQAHHAIELLRKRFS